jgi:protein phosphatase
MLPQRPLRVSWVTKAAALSDVGRVRAENQDAYGVFPALGLYVVADGLGGHVSGSVASAMVVEEVRRSLASAGDDDLTPVTDAAGRSSLAGRRLVIAVENANERIREASREPGRQGMGSTVASVLLDEVHEVLAVCHVGDSRVYRVRRGTIEQLTEDDTVVQQWVREGRIDPEDAGASPHRHMITQAVGTQELVRPALRLERPEPGDVFVLTSDGIHDRVPAGEIAAVVSEAADDLDVACFRLVDLANERGGRDNATVVLLRYLGAAAAPGSDDPTLAV